MLPQNHRPNAIWELCDWRGLTMQGGARCWVGTRETTEREAKIIQKP